MSPLRVVHTPRMRRAEGDRGVELLATAFFFHAPGLWVFFRRRVGAGTARRNALAAGLTLAAMAAGYARGGGWTAAALWGIGHVVWGLWLAARVRRGVADE